MTDINSNNAFVVFFVCFLISSLEGTKSTGPNRSYININKICRTVCPGEPGGIMVMSMIGIFRSVCMHTVETA